MIDIRIEALEDPVVNGVLTQIWLIVGPLGPYTQSMIILLVSEYINGTNIVGS